ncbi:MAG: hypothetical protein SGJ27_06835 [Candidatus Melainabacteria bacterium]|nr:hypothetical protein [Candidatus Melainabacteria bacterium]
MVRIARLSFLAIVFSGSLLSGFTSSEPDGDVHAGVVREGLSGTICPANIEVIINGSKAQDSQANDADSEEQRHFETKNVNRSYEYVKREQKKILNYAADADSNAESRTRALYHFGMMLHTVQDFYSNTNYLKLKVDELDRTTDGGFDPYSIDLFDWARLSENNPAAVGGAELKVDPAAKAKMSQPLQDTTYGKVARGLAIRETTRQWTFLEALLRNKYGERSATILLALRQASCLQRIPTEAEDAIEAGD